MEAPPDAICLRESEPVTPQRGSCAFEGMEVFLMDHSLDALGEEKCAGTPPMHTLETTTLCVVEAEAEAAFRERMPRAAPDGAGNELVAARDGEEQQSSPKARKLSLETLVKLQHLPLTSAAKACGFCTTQFKLLCRELGVARWPHRQNMVLLKLLNTLGKLRTGGSPGWGDQAPAIDGWLEELEKVQHSTEKTILDDLPVPVEALSRWVNKHRSLAKSAGKSPHAAAAAAAAVPLLCLTLYK